MLANPTALAAAQAYQATLQKVILGQTAGLNPVMVKCGPGWAQVMSNKIGAVIALYQQVHGV